MSEDIKNAEQETQAVEEQQAKVETPKETGKDVKPEDEKKYSDADLDKIIGQKLSKWKKQQEAAVSEAEKLATMNAQQKAEYERDQLQKKLDELTREKTLADMKTETRKELATKGIVISDEILSVLVSEDAETTKTAVEAYALAFEEAVKKGVAEAIHSGTPKTGGVTKLTKEDIFKIQDRRQRQEMMRKHSDLFK